MPDIPHHSILPLLISLALRHITDEHMPQLRRKSFVTAEGPPSQYAYGTPNR